MIEIPTLMRDLAIKRPLFHSEADFQHALAWLIHEKHPDYGVRLEYTSSVNVGEEKMQLDIWLAKPGIAIELKYKTGKPKDAIKFNSESYDLRDQSAQTQGRYDFLKDIQRLESLSGFPNAKAGFAILLTNDALYWRGPARKNTVDAAFSLRGDPGLRIQGEMAWSRRASVGTTRGRGKPIRLKGSYEVEWQAYSRIAGGRYGEFRYLVVRAAIR